MNATASTLLALLIVAAWSWTLAVPAWMWLPMTGVILVAWLCVNARTNDS
jgi:hypothetical protein